jgi:hypothetical protein
VLRSWIRIALPLRLWLLSFVTSFYGNGGTKFSDKIPAEHCLVLLVREMFSDPAATTDLQNWEENLQK